MKDRLRRAWAWIDRWFPWLALVGVVVGLGLVVRGQWSAISELDWAGSWKILLASGVLFALAPLAQATTFWLILRLLGARSPFGEAMVIWAQSYVLRYAPTGALAVVYRIRERERLAASREQILASEAYEHLGSITAGACACVLGFAALGTVPPWLGLTVAVPIIVFAVAVRPKFLGRWAQVLLRRFGIETPLLRGRQVAAVVLVNLLAWLGTGAGFLVILNGLSDEAAPGIVWAIAIYSVGFLIGFIVPFLPGGLGAREGTLIAVLAPRYGAGAATGISLATRLAVTVGEAIAIGVIWGAYWARRAARRRVSQKRLMPPA